MFYHPLMDLHSLEKSLLYCFILWLNAADPAVILTLYARGLHLVAFGT